MGGPFSDGVGGDGDLGGQSETGEDLAHTEHERLGSGEHGTAAQEQPVDVQEPYEIGRTGAQDTRRPGEVAARDGGQAQDLQAAAPTAVARGPSS